MSDGEEMFEAARFGLRCLGCGLLIAFVAVGVIGFLIGKALL